MLQRQIWAQEVYDKITLRAFQSFPPPPPPPAPPTLAHSLSPSLHPSLSICFALGAEAQTVPARRELAPPTHTSLICGGGTWGMCVLALVCLRPSLALSFSRAHGHTGPSLSLSVKYHVPNEHANVHDASMDATMPNGIGSRLAQARLDNCLVA